MSFNKRLITEDRILNSYRENGVDAVWKLYTKGVDAISMRGELAKKCRDAIFADSHEVLAETLRKWNK